MKEPLIAVLLLGVRTGVLLLLLLLLTAGLAGITFGLGGLGAWCCRRSLMVSSLDSPTL